MRISAHDDGVGVASAARSTSGDVYSDAETVTLAFDTDPVAVRLELRGDLTESAFTAARERALSDPRYVQGMNWMIDCRVLTSIPKPAQLTALARTQLTFSISGRIGRTAIVALTRTGLDFAYRWQQLDRDETGMRVFTDPEDARDWLEAPPVRL